MKSFTIASVLAVAGLVSAQTPAGFTPVVEQHLSVLFGTKAIDPAGTSVPKADTGKIPTIGYELALNGTYLLIVIDLDVPASLTAPNSGPRRTNLHGLIAGFKSATTPNAAGIYILSTTSTTPKAYVGPQPPAENPPHAHRYVELLYEQPPNFAVPASETSQVQRGIGFNIETFATAAKLGKPIAANYFNVTG